MNRSIPALLLVLMLRAPAAHAQTNTDAAVDPGQAVARVVGLEAARKTAMIASDTEALAGLIAANAIYVHSNGMLQDRDALFQMLERGEIRYVTFNTETVEYRAYGATVVGTGVQSIDLTSGGKPFVSRSRFTVVYAPADGDVRLVAYQSTTMPEMGAPKKK